MNWLRTAASAYSNLTADSEWPKYDVLESNKVLSIFTEKNKLVIQSCSLMRNVGIIHLHVLHIHLLLKQVMNL
jgi:hypothetical protein